MTEQVALIAAVAENGVIGHQGMLPWGRMQADLQRFKTLTMGHHLLMGRKTWDSVGRPLVGRPIVVITRGELSVPEGVSTAANIDEAIDRALDAGDEQPFVAGGAEIYAASIDRVDCLYLTRIHASFEGDTKFPAYDGTPWRLREYVDYPADERNPYPWSFRTYDRFPERVLSSLAKLGL